MSAATKIYHTKRFTLFRDAQRVLGMDPLSIARVDVEELEELRDFYGTELLFLLDVRYAGGCYLFSVGQLLTWVSEGLLTARLDKNNIRALAVPLAWGINLGPDALAALGEGCSDVSYKVKSGYVTN